VICLRVAPTIGPLLVKALDAFLQNVQLSDVIGKLVTIRRETYTVK